MYSWFNVWMVGVLLTQFQYFFFSRNEILHAIAIQMIFIWIVCDTFATIHLKAIYYSCCIQSIFHLIHITSIVKQKLVLLPCSRCFVFVILICRADWVMNFILFFSLRLFSIDEAHLFHSSQFTTCHYRKRNSIWVNMKHFKLIGWWIGMFQTK